MTTGDKLLLREFVTLDYKAEAIREQVEAKKPIMLSGCFQRANALNANKRIYPKECLAYGK